MLCNPISILVVGIPPLCEPNSCAREQWLWRGMTDVFHYNNVTRALWRLQSPFNFLFALTTKKQQSSTSLVLREGNSCLCPDVMGFRALTSTNGMSYFFVFVSELMVFFMYVSVDSWGPLYQHGLTLIPAWISILISIIICVIELFILSQTSTVAPLKVANR